MGTISNARAIQAAHLSQHAGGTSMFRAQRAVQVLTLSLSADPANAGHARG
jgi:hypothetical protein